ncbi:FxsA family protein [Alteromonadaceae bacterium M269]|nr:FxsA family protein [Alteromonadaceae bacterium M269]
MGKLFLLFVALPIIEIAVLVNVGEMIGGWNTIAIVIFTAFAGAYLVRQQGLSTLTQAQQKMQTGQMPGQELAEGLLLVIAGVLLVTPGFVTDGLGFLFCLPMTRPVIAKLLIKNFPMNVVTNHQQPFQQSQPFEQARRNQGNVFEGEFETKDDARDNDKIERH